jgi:glycosyltransferase involved in cell wall biosynthesis
MKVLSVAWISYDERIPELSTDCSGGGAGVVIRNICEYIGRKVESYLFIGKMQLDGAKCGNYRIVNTKRAIPDSIVEANERRTYVFSQVLDELHPDIVNVHGAGIFARMCLEKCSQRGVPCVYTDHIYVGRKREFEKYEVSFEWDDAILSMPDLNIVAVSTGTRSKILKEYPQISPQKIRAIPNGTNFTAEYKNSDLTSKYDLKGFRVLACVGTLLDRKNQLQVVRAFKYLSSDVKDKIKIIFCGKDRLDGQFQKAVAEAHLENQLIYVGTFSNEEMKELYSAVDGMILPSYSEGLSIAMLEAIAYGLPVIMYSDSECADDLDDEEACSFAEDRSDSALAIAIENWYYKKWDRKYIKQYSKKFTMERVADEYIAYYSNILKDFREKTNE